MPRQRHPPTAQLELPAPDTIGFRLDESSGQVLLERAQRLGLSPHELAREYVLEHLQETEERSALRQAFQELHQIVQELHGAQQQFRSDFAFAIEALLASAGKVSPEEARGWVAKSLTTE